MAKFPCRCSYVISLINSPVSEEFTLVPNKLLYSLAEQAGKGKLSFEEFFDRIDAASKDVITCPVCGRVWMKKTGSSEYWPYLEEKE
ncbi:hypothetical protein [Pseudomonas sp. RGB]|uniref:hypothetical protein n=1 Tax=Pseudomonas sp. RGB TaxID=2598474 RepID=UPI001197C37D|nr:hypothetical protein [Pseudomonas sp. RGB]TVT91561.1 hypothetical protein FPT15_07295 [Pseudomonas sp. RGB]